MEVRRPRRMQGCRRPPTRQSRCRCRRPTSQYPRDTGRGPQTSPTVFILLALSFIHSWKTYCIKNGKAALIVTFMKILIIYDNEKKVSLIIQVLNHLTSVHKKLRLCHKLIFSIPIYLCNPISQTLDISNYKFCEIKYSKVEISKVYAIRFLRYRG